MSCADEMDNLGFWPSKGPKMPLSDRGFANEHVLDELSNWERHTDRPAARWDVHVDDSVAVNIDCNRIIAERFDFIGTQDVSPDAFITRASVNSPALVPLINRILRPVTAHDRLSTGLLPSMPLEIKPIPIMPLSITQSAHDVRPHRCEDAHA
jgi:hypothetical protein